MDKEKILNFITTEQIYCKFLNLDKFPKKNIHSPFSEDNNASFKLFDNGTFKCFSTGKQGDVFQFVAYLNNLDCKSDFKRVTDIIAHECGIVGDVPETRELKVYHHDAMSPAHLKYWSDLGIDKHLLDLYCVQPVKAYEYWSAKKNAYVKFPVYKGVLAFSYKVNTRYEVYIPEQPDKKVKKAFCSGLQNDDIFGLSQLAEHVEMLVVCAGKKDCLSLIVRGFPAVTLRSEAVFPTAEQINRLKAKCNQLYICYDNDFDKPDNPGQSQMLKIAEKYSLSPLLLPDKINDVTDYFTDHNGSDFKQLIESCQAEEKQRRQAEEEGKQTIFHVAEKYLSAFYDFRFNTVKLDIEASPKRQNAFASLNENSLYIELQKHGVNISMDKLLSILKSEYVPRFDPFIHYFRSLPRYNAKREGDPIAKLAAYVSAAEPLPFLFHFRKWLVRTVKCATIPDYFNKQAFILVHSEQNSGKSTFCRFLCPPSLSDYIAEDISNDKDARILLCKNFLINLDELAVLSRQEINSLKSYFSKTQINERLPYDRKNSIINRTCSFIGSTNMDEFLNDETGSVRWLCFRINSINWDYRAQVDINRVWAQADRKSVV